MYPYGAGFPCGPVCCGCGCGCGIIAIALVLFILLFMSGCCGRPCGLC